MAKKILVVDDDQDILEAIKIILTEAGYKVETSEKGDELLPSHLSKLDGKPDLIILDILLSGVDGRDLCKYLRREKQTQDIPVIMISAHVGSESSAILCGADAFISKPFEIDDLLGTINRLLS